MKVLIADDSAVVRMQVQRLLRRTPDVEETIAARDGKDAVEKALEHRPDLILMDLHMPRMDGYEAIVAIMASEAYCPIVVLSGAISDVRRPESLRCFEAGAVEVLPKPGRGLANEEFERHLVNVLRTMSRARVRRRLTTEEASPPRVPISQRRARQRDAAAAASGRGPELIAIGSSTGGPPVLRSLLAALPRPCPVPVVIAQHILVGFDRSLADWLAGSGHPVELLDSPRRLEAGTVYLAPGDRHMVLSSKDHLRLQEPVPGEMIPSADHLLTSVAEFYGDRAVGVVLTGMGSDGAIGLKRMRDSGAHTMTQLGETCVVNGMPEAARKAGGSCVALSPEDLATALMRRVSLATAAA